MQTHIGAMEKACVTCGVMFAPRGHGGPRVACSRKCGAIYRRGKKPDAYVKDGVGYLPLQRGRWAMVDEADFSRCARHNWVTNSKDVVQAFIDGKHVKLHRLIMGALPGQIVDHQNGDSMDNRRGNLRAATGRENCYNRRKMTPGTSSKYKGVCFHKATGKWFAQIRIKGVITHLGQFASEEDAARTYDINARLHYGAFACLNFPQPGERPALAA